MVPNAERIERNNATFRRANERIRESAEEYAVGNGPVPFICECADETCTAVFQMSLDDYAEVRASDRLFLLVSRNHAGAEGAGTIVHERDDYVVFEKGKHDGAAA